jgi:hypothetical protein
MIADFLNSLESLGGTQLLDAMQSLLCTEIVVVRKGYEKIVGGDPKF